ncbi:MAG: hypothetical protein GC159_23060 [Phycisphaera sp.]|nr:hypothetical protein [Phycisphaera sp.]
MAKLSPKQRSDFIEAVTRHGLAASDEWRQFNYSTSENIAEGGVDFIFAGPDDNAKPDDIFKRLRWGGQLIFFSPDAAEVEKTVSGYATREWVVETKMANTLGPPKFLWFGKTKIYYAIIRKVMIVPIGDFSERFTFHVELQRHPKYNNEYVVRKELPRIDVVEKRLATRHPDLTEADIRKRAKMFVGTIFPIFLTREAGIMRVLEKYLPEEYEGRVPKIVDLKQNEKGHVTQLYMTLLRNARPHGRNLTQFEFARQSCDLMRALHDEARVIHLDLRLDNFVVCEKGVGFIDFGSAVRVGEDLSKSELLMQMFEQVMTTSQIQKTLGKMSQSGRVTSRILRSGYRKVDKAVDLFFVALQMNKPLKNPDFANLIEYDKDSREAALIHKLTEKIFRPRDPDNPPFKTAKDICKGLQVIEGLLKNPGKPEGESGLLGD